LKRIKVLPESVKNKISAGEVVEGPFSVVKELIENSIDANASQIDVQIFDSGLKKVVVTDDGDGIYSEDIGLTILEHATSKIDDVYDIERIDSYGFRGEALSSISSISALTILTRPTNEDVGAKLSNGTGEIKISPYAGAAGTKIIVENLFYNIPARKKFLKAKRTELKYIRETLLKTALANPSIGFSFEVDGKRSITLNSVESHEERVKQVYGNDVFQGLYFESLQDIKVRISGFLSRPDFLRSSRTMQMFFVNKRAVEYKYLGYLLSRAYEAVAIKGKYPAALIFIEIDPELVDVNIHPAKREVKLFDQRYIDSLILSLAENVLNKTHTIDERFFKSDNIPGAGPFPFPDVEGSSPVQNEPEPEFQAGLSFTQKSHDGPSPSSVAMNRPEQSLQEYRNRGSMVNDISRMYSDVMDDVTWSIIGVAFDTYIIVQDGESLLFVDFHAAHERFVYDSLVKRDNAFEVQELMFPVVMELPLEDYSIIIDNLGKFFEIGFDIEDFSDNTITVRAVPLLKGPIDAESFLRNLIEEIKEEKEKKLDMRQTIAASVACHSARRAGDKISADEACILVKKAFSGKYDKRCPHGRPFIHKIDKNSLERIFKR